MKGYYIFAPVEEACVGAYSGVEKKIRNFCEILNESVDIELDILSPYIQDNSRIKRIFRRWALWKPVGHTWDFEDKYTDADFLYIRKAEHDAAFLRFLKKNKKANPKIKILYEIPTYPYEKEQKITLGNLPIHIKDRIFRKYLKKYIDRIITFYNQKEILGIPTICIMNGYNFSNMSEEHYTISDESINLIEVSTTAFWHGYDRIIEGMHQYYEKGGKNNFIFHMVGPCMNDHVELVKKYGLEDHVIFYGKKSSKELDAIYKKCSIGIDVLGGHRKDYPISSSLKSREYAEKGMLIITSSPIDYIPEGYKYQMVCPYNDSPIDMNAVSEFYDGIFGSESVEEVVGNVRTIAVENCDFHVTLKPVINYLNEGQI